jgi:hypothetical protein
MKPVHFYQQSARRGVALVIVLSFVVLLTVVVVAFFSRAMSDRQVSNSSANQSRADLLARSALDVVLGDLKEEIRTGSTTSAALPAIYTPTPSANILPQRSPTAGAALPNLVRTSIRGDLIAAPAVASRASAASSTADPSLNGRSVSLARWNSHYLLPRHDTSATIDSTPISPLNTPPEAAGFTPPDWVYVTSNGPAVQTTPDPATVGRYAFAIYDEGGLLDINVAGYPSNTTAAQTGPKGSVAFADLSQLPYPIPKTPAGASQIDTIVGWRNYATAQPGGTLAGNYAFDAAAATRYFNYVLGNTTGFLSVSPQPFPSPVIAASRTDQRFDSRQSLLKFRRLTGFSQNALQYLGTFNREMNAPSWSPSADIGTYQYKTNADSDSSINRNLANVRVKMPFIRPDGSQANVGDVLLKKRFPLSRLALITLTATDTGNGDIYKFFGLTRASATANWTYNHGAANRILTLADVSQAGREPDMFELLQAAILNGSLGKTGGNTLAQTDAPDSNTYYQLIRIGANIIDQYDSDSIPTTISFDGNDFYGIENLPYLNQIFVLIAKNTVKTPKPIDNFQLYPYLAFQLWNPHDAGLSGSASATPLAIRIRPLAGGTMYVRGGQDPSSPPPDAAEFPPFDGTTSIAIPASDFSNYAQPNIPATDFVGPIFDVSALSLRPPAKPMYDQSFAWLWFEIPSSTVIALEYKDAAGWHPYSTFAGLATLPVTGLLNDPGATAGNGSIPYPILYSFAADQACKAPVTPPARAIMSNPTWYNSMIKSDPRTSRFGASFSALIKPAGQPSPPAGYLLDGKQNTAVRPTSAASVNGGNGYWAANGRPNWCSAAVFYPGLLAQNTTSGQQYADRDTTVRSGDGAVNLAGPVNPLYDPAQSPSNEDKASRPVILNRPFRSVGELAYVFRDQPWKTLDFSSAKSADAGLLDIFSVDESDMTAARVSLNTRQTSALTAIISGTSTTEAAVPAPIANAAAVSGAVAAVTQTTPLLNRSELISKVMSTAAMTTAIGNTVEQKVKSQREAAVRALSETTQTRTWNLMIDVIAQSGRFTPNAGSLSQFVVEGEKRYWLHVAIDRFTGEVIDQQLEPVYE